MPPLRTRLYDVHAPSGATFIEFGGWEMPLQYVGILAEHTAVRRDAGLFDVSHMGKIMIWGPTAWSFLDRLSANDIPKKPFRARYTHLLDDDGRIIDDVIVTCLAPDRYFMVCNAGPRPRVLGWLRKHCAGEHIQDVTQDYLCLALQGPKAARILQILTAYNLETIKPFTGAFLHLLLSERLGTSRPPTPRPPEAVGWGPS
ncbi:MAG: hypothetical protein HY557_00535, partial [Euryarchaeota archaeon]|nr:hypothetical protein [Euryarchaeota archaeon]